MTDRDGASEPVSPQPRLATGRLLLRLVGLTGPIAGQFPITYAKG